MGPQPCEKLIQHSDPGRKDGASLTHYLIYQSCLVFGVVMAMLCPLSGAVSSEDLCNSAHLRCAVHDSPVLPGTWSNSHVLSVFLQTWAELGNSQFDHTPVGTQKSCLVQNRL